MYSFDDLKEYIPDDYLLRVASNYPRVKVTVSSEAIMPRIKKVIFNPPATIVFWDDDTKTVVKDTDGGWEKVRKSPKAKRQKKLEAWKEAGLLNAIAKKFYKNYQAEIDEWVIGKDA